MKSKLLFLLICSAVGIFNVYISTVVDSIIALTSIILLNIAAVILTNYVLRHEKRPNED